LVFRDGPRGRPFRRAAATVLGGENDPKVKVRKGGGSKNCLKRLRQRERNPHIHGMVPAGGKSRQKGRAGEIKEGCLGGGKVPPFVELATPERGLCISRLGGRIDLVGSFGKGGPEGLLLVSPTRFWQGLTDFAIENPQGSKDRGLTRQRRRKKERKWAVN